MSNLLSCTAERVYFKDLQSRFLFVSAGWVAAYAPGHIAAELIGKTDFDFFGQEHACAAFEDEQQIIRTGEPIIGKLEQETGGGLVGAWVSSTKMPLRDESGQIVGTFGISRDPRFPGRVAEIIGRHGLHPPQLCLEITETALIAEAGHVRETLSALSAIGVRIALDDFGTGYSSLVYLQRLNADILKIDRSFVEHISRSTRDREIVAAVTAMSHALGMTVVGEGIETSRQLATLAGLDCDEGQGLLFGHLLSPGAVLTLIESRQGAGPRGENPLSHAE
jgi:EAL domain/PAS fold